jgi:hypothetical protein
LRDRRSPAAGNQAGLIAQRQNDIQAHDLIFGKASDSLRLIGAHRISHMVRQ